MWKIYVILTTTSKKIKSSPYIIDFHTNQIDLNWFTSALLLRQGRNHKPFVHGDFLLPLECHSFHLCYCYDDYQVHQEKLFAFENAPFCLELDRIRQDSRAVNKIVQRLFFFFGCNLSKDLSLCLMMSSFYKPLCQLLTLLFQESNVTRTISTSFCTLYNAASKSREVWGLRYRLWIS